MGHWDLVFAPVGRRIGHGASQREPDLRARIRRMVHPPSRTSFR